MARPKKYKTEEETKAAKMKNRVRGRHFFLTLPALDQTEDEIEELKSKVFHELCQRQLKHSLEHLGVVRQVHKDGKLHLHVYVQYVKPVCLSLKHFDYLPKHPNLQRVKNLKNVLNYLVKEDSKPLFSKGFNPTYEVDKLRIEKEPYALLREAMLRDPLNFEAHAWLADNNLDVAASKGNWPKAIAQVKQRQQIEANKTLRSTIGIIPITRQLIVRSLTSNELKLYDSWDGYQKIVDHLNDIPTYGYHRPHKKKNLLLVGRPDIGKTALARKIRQFVAVYSFGVDNWFPRYQNRVYQLILWNQFYLRAMPYGQLLNVLEGEPTDLPFKGGSVLKRDNQLIYITSNMTLQQHICSRFKDQQKRALARANLRVRVDQIVIPEDKDLFILLKLIQPAEVKP